MIPSTVPATPDTLAQVAGEWDRALQMSSMLSSMTWHIVVCNALKMRNGTRHLSFMVMHTRRHAGWTWILLFQPNPQCVGST